MLFYLLYWLIAPILWILLIPASLFNSKIRHHLLNESRTLQFSKEKIQKNINEKIVVHFHASSMGEFEQLQPILKKMDRNKFFILLSFFSSTGYKHEKDTQLADTVCYHPFDFIWSAWFFFKKMNINYYITTRNDIWPNHLFVAKKLGIHSIIINANLYRESHYKSFFLKYIYKNIFDQFDMILTGSERLKRNLMNLVSEEKIHVTGDSRIDRILERKKRAQKELLPNSYEKSRTIILGSIEKTDYEILFSAFEKYYPNGQATLESKNHQLIIVPHEIDLKNLNIIYSKLNKLGFEATFFDDKANLIKSRVVIINVVGILADLYRYSDLAYIGAGFNAGVHSVLEPAVYANAISFGPRYHIVDTAINLVDLKLAKVINSRDDFTLFLDLLDDEDDLSTIKKNMAKYIKEQKVASYNIINKIFYNE